MTHSKREFVSEYRNFEGYGLGRVVMRYDDRCKNGHDTFSIAVDSKKQSAGAFGGCMHDALVKAFPEFAEFVKWHLVSDAGPMHYIANTVYHAENGDLEYARSTAIAPNAPIEHLKDANMLKLRLPVLMAAFHEAMSKIDWQVAE